MSSSSIASHLLPEGLIFSSLVKWYVITSQSGKRPKKLINMTERYTHLLLNGANEEVKKEAVKYCKAEQNENTKH